MSDAPKDELPNLRPIWAAAIVAAAVVGTIVTLWPNAATRRMEKRYSSSIASTPK
jgi:hypothetical protein